MNVLQEKKGKKTNRAYVTVLHKAELFAFFFLINTSKFTFSHTGEHTAGLLYKKKKAMSIYIDLLRTADLLQ